MKPQTALLFMFAAIPVLAASATAQQTGVSNPPDAVVQDAPLETSPAKPSAAIPMQPAPPVAAPAEEFGAYKPYGGAAVTLRTHVEAADPDAGIVTDIPRRHNELPVGTALRIRMNDGIATETTQSNTPFTAQLTEDVTSEGRVMLPAGSSVEGTITEVRGGRRLHGTALIHLQAQTIVLPDGTRMHIRASVIDTDQYANTRVDEEGNILRKDHVGATLAAMSLTTGGAAAAGAVVGGGVGALVGAGVGAGLSTAWWLKQDRQTQLPKDSLVVLSLNEPILLDGPHAEDPRFSAAPAAAPDASAMKATDVPAPAPYVAPQAFVPTN